MGARCDQQFELLHRAEFESRQGLLGKPQLALRVGFACLEHRRVGQLGQEFLQALGEH